MLKSDGDKNGKKSIGPIGKNNNFARAVHFFLHFFAVVVATWNFLVLRFMKKMSYIKSHDRSHYGSCVHVCAHKKKKVVCVPFRFFFFTAAHFHLTGR